MDKTKATDKPPQRPIQPLKSYTHASAIDIWKRMPEAQRELLKEKTRMGQYIAGSKSKEVFKHMLPVMLEEAHQLRLIR